MSGSSGGPSGTSAGAGGKAAGNSQGGGMMATPQQGGGMMPQQGGGMMPQQGGGMTPGGTLGALVNPYDQAAASQRAALAGTQGAMQGAAVDPWSFSAPAPYGVQTAYTAPTIRPATTSGIAKVNDPQSINSAAKKYYDPYTGQVIERTTANMQRALEEQVTGLDADAAAAGAFGGSRHGIAEGVATADTNRAIGDVTAELSRDRFRTAMDLGGQDVANDMSADATNAGAINTGRQFNAAQRLAARQGNQAVKARAAEFARTGEQTNADRLAGILSGNADRAAGVADRASGRQLEGAAQLGALGAQSYGYGDRLNQQMESQGSQAQQIAQALMGQSAGMYDKFLGQGMNTLNTRISSLSLNPLNNAGTQTQHTKMPNQGGGAMDVLGMMVPLFAK